MLCLIKHGSIVLLSFGEFLAHDRTKCFQMMNHACLDIFLLILYPAELKYYILVISLNKCTEICNVLSLKICVPKETKDINV